MSDYTIADLAAGGRLVRHLKCGPDQLSGNVASHEVAIEGTHDLYCKRYDAEAQRVVDYQPQRPNDDHEWNGREWVLRPDVLKRAHRKALALESIRELERDGSLRRMRELLIELTHDPRLKAIDQQIAKLRPDL